MELVFHPVKKVEIVVRGEKQAFVEQLFKNAKIKGYTLIKDVAGMGRHGYHDSHLLFNELDAYVMFIAVASPSAVEVVAQGLMPVLQNESGVMFVSDASVVRAERF